jgi:hypothetical protein
LTFAAVKVVPTKMLKLSSSQSCDHELPTVSVVHIKA